MSAGMALLHNKREINDLFWELSGTVMAVSLATRASVERRLSEQTDKENRARGRAEGIRSVVAGEVKQDADIKRVAKNIVHALETLGGSASRSDVRDKIIAKRDRYLFDDAVSAVVADGLMKVTQEGRGEGFSLLGRCA